jgi:hypothetical protein
MRCAIALALLTSALAAQQPKWKSTTPINDRPNPYRRDANWAQLPAGLKWGAPVRAKPTARLERHLPEVARLYGLAAIGSALGARG